MGFPANCPDIVVPRFLLRALFLLGYIRSLLCCFLKAVGLEELLLDTDNSPWFQTNQHTDHNIESSQQHTQELLNFSSLSAKKIQDSLPVVKYEELAAEAGRVVGDSCAVCLCELEAEDEVRRLSNCRHVFHRGCLDRWTEHEQCTCPLCRTPLVDGLPRAENCSDEMVWESDNGVFDFENNEEELYSFFTLSSSAGLVVPQQTSSAMLLSSQFF